MHQVDDNMNNLKVVKHNSHYGNLDKTPNQLYKSYVAYIEGKGQTPMPFTDWMKWATDKGLVKNLNASGNNELQPVTEPEISKVKNTGKIIAGVIITAIALTIIITASVNSKETN